MTRKKLIEKHMEDWEKEAFEFASKVHHGDKDDAGRLGTPDELKKVKVTFGRYKNKMLSELPKHYIDWANLKVQDVENKPSR